MLQQSTSQQLYPMQPQYQSTSAQYHPLQPQYYTTSLQYHPQHHPTSQYNPITSQHLHNDLQHHAISSQCNSTYPQHCSPLLSTYNDDEGDEHPTLSHADPLPVTKETEKTTTCDNETFKFVASNHAVFILDFQLSPDRFDTCQYTKSEKVYRIYRISSLLFRRLTVSNNNY